MLNPKGTLQRVACMPLSDTQRTCAQSAYGWPTIHGSWREIVSAGICTVVSLKTIEPSWKRCEVASSNW